MPRARLGRRGQRIHRDRDRTRQRGQHADATYGPVKVDLTNPTVTCDDRVTYLLHQTGTLVGADVTDTPSGPVRAREVRAVDTGTVGDQTATVTGTDLAGRTGSDVCDYRVVYGFSGFQSPVNGSAGAVNVVKAGKVVPLKWLLADAAGVPVTTLGSVHVSIGQPHAARRRRRGAGPGRGDRRRRFGSAELR